MKTAAITMIVLVLTVGGVIGWGLFHTDLEIIGKGLQTVAATDKAAEFEALRTAVERQSLMGTKLKNGALGPAGNYSYYIYTLRLRNTGLVTAEMVEMQISPAAGDVLFYGEEGEADIAPGATRDVWCVLLTEGTPSPVREIYVTYYLWGHPLEVKFTYDNTL